MIMFSPNGVIPDDFLARRGGRKFTFKESLKPLEPFQSRTLV